METNVYLLCYSSCLAFVACLVGFLLFWFIAVFHTLLVDLCIGGRVGKWSIGRIRIPGEQVVCGCLPWV